MAKIGSIVLHVSDVPRAAAFWRAAIGYSSAPGREAMLGPDSGDGPRLHLDEDDRTHLDLWVDGAEEQRAEVERLVSLGATRVEWTYPEDADFVVLADTEGNVFCIVDSNSP
jgi:catechol 2,3-dioxygenase-like lactoylglutathione lyase family enzyme